MVSYGRPYDSYGRPYGPYGRPYGFHRISLRKLASQGFELAYVVSDTHIVLPIIDIDAKQKLFRFHMVDHMSDHKKPYESYGRP